MAWVKLDDSFPDHPKVLLAGPLAAWLHVCGLAYCNRMLTDGFIPFAKAHTLADFTGLAEVNGYEGQDVDASLLAERLVDVGIWEKVRGGYTVRNYLDYQPSRAEVESKRAVRSAAGKLGGKQSGSTRRSKTEAKPKQTTEQNGTTSEAKHELDANPVPVPVPLVLPSRSDLRVLGSEAAGEGEIIGKRSGDDLGPLLDWAAEKLPNWAVGGLRNRTLDVLDELSEHADARLIEEAIGYCGDLDSVPAHPKFLLSTVKAWYVQRGCGDYWPEAAP